MNLYDYKYTFYLVIILIYITMESCSVMGLTVGAIVDKHDKKNYDIPFIEGKGWILPPKSKCNLELFLTNNDNFFGRYQGMEYK